VQRLNQIASLLCLSLTLFLSGSAHAATLEKRPNDPYFQKFHPLKAPPTKRLLLQKGDRLAICGDSITEQRMYSRIMETYLTVCVPELEVTARQYGWSGEKTAGFVDRMANDCLRFKPTVATTCYGMNDHEYRPFVSRIGKRYRTESECMVEAFKASGCRVVLGSPGCVGKVPWWVTTAAGTVDDLNVNLCELRNIGIEVARREHVAFADVFWPMLTAGFDARGRNDYQIAGKDGVHPGWAGHLVMAYAFLKSLGLAGDLGVITVDLSDKRPVTISPGHELLSSGARPGELKIRSTRYPFCATNTAVDDNTIRSAMTLVPFNEELNRFVLIAKNGPGKSYKVTWGEQSRVYSARELAAGVNLARDFPVNPFWPAFHQVDEAVAAKQAFETKQVKEQFHSAEARTNMTPIVARTEIERSKLAADIRAAFAPVDHSIFIQAEGSTP
jgi:lysophospholipase L1-like esterase